MTLAPGDKLGPYEILAHIRAGEIRIVLLGTRAGPGADAGASDGRQGDTGVG
jgi:hypothetical protein